ncbi:Scr1 family TA system antitoxin-like transcriptional regulator [Streptomyces sp. NPDC056831]|uniref:Scr1 family TA system antitoxin-like transcriptional regulator n=1 Tax=Streptomyces sp. NPDC056831 TaxID=3345954 RepID=UPI00368343FD
MTPRSALCGHARTGVGRDCAGHRHRRAQLLHLLDASERPNVTLHVIPFAAGGFPLLGDSSVLYAEAPNQPLDTVQLDSPTGAVFIDSPTQLANFRTRLDMVEKVALTPVKSRDFIRSVLREL